MWIVGYIVRNTKRIKMQDASCTSSTPNSTLHTPHSKGFTLFEVIITIVIVGIISSIAALIILEGMKASSQEQNLSNAHYQARLAMERMSRDIRLIRSTDPADITAYTATNLRFMDVNGASSGFQLTGTTLNRWNGVGNDVLASGISALSFSYYKNDNTAAILPADLNLLWFIDIVITSQQGSDTLQMRTRVHPRNF